MKVHPKNSINVILQVFDWGEENKITDFRIAKSFERQKFPNIVASVKVNLLLDSGSAEYLGTTKKHDAVCLHSPYFLFK